MSTAAHLPYELASGNVAIVADVEIIDPAHLPLGGPAEPGMWAETYQIMDAGDRVLVDFEYRDRLDDGTLAVDPPAVTAEGGPGDYNHLDVRFDHAA